MTRTRFSRRCCSLSILSLLVGIALSPGAQAQSLTTFFNSNNGNTQGGGVFFDLNAVSALTLNSLGVNANVGTADPGSILLGAPISLEVWTRSGTATGFEGSAAGWTLRSTGSGVAAAINTPSFVDIADFVLGPGITGVAIRNIGYIAQYTGTAVTPPPSVFFSNVDLSLSAGSATNDFFVGGTVRTPRVWNGTISYSGGFVGPEPGTLALLTLGIVGGVVVRRRK